MKDYMISMFIDRNSVMWVGTVREGLLKMDLMQKNFISFKHDGLDPNSLSSNKVYEITEQKDGKLWVGTSNGVSLFDPQTYSFTSYTTENSNINDNMVLTCDGSGFEI